MEGSYCLKVDPERAMNETKRAQRISVLVIITSGGYPKIFAESTPFYESNFNIKIHKNSLIISNFKYQKQ